MTPPKGNRIVNMKPARIPWMVMRLPVLTPLELVVTPPLVPDVEALPEVPVTNPVVVVQSVVARLTIASAVRPRAGSPRATRNGFASMLRLTLLASPVWSGRSCPVCVGAGESVVDDPLLDVAAAALLAVDDVAAPVEEELHALAAAPLDKNGLVSVPPWAVESNVTEP